ncbi:MAG: hypothetical protein MZV70_30685 [Desulfobacterales bacterium]|nr:hypothetical protein [Desulfobacterales bacterium]
MAFFIAATNAHEETGLRRLQVLLPVRDGRDAGASPGPFSLEDFLDLIRACKEKSVADRPIMNATADKKRAARSHPAQVITDQLGLTEQEAEDPRVHPPAPDGKRDGTAKGAGNPQGGRDCQPPDPESGSTGIVTDCKERGWGRWRSL